MSFYKQMLGKKLSIKDLEAVDTEFYNSLVWMKYVSCQSLCLILCLGAHAPKAYGSRFVYVCICMSVTLISQRLIKTRHWQMLTGTVR